MVDFLLGKETNLYQLFCEPDTTITDEWRLKPQATFAMLLLFKNKNVNVTLEHVGPIVYRTALE